MAALSIARFVEKLFIYIGLLKTSVLPADWLANC
jgi:hypothetical protein